MVADFRQLGMGSLAARGEGENVSEVEQQRRNAICIAQATARARGETYVYDSPNESEEVKAARAHIDEIEEAFAVKRVINFLCSFFFSVLMFFTRLTFLSMKSIHFEKRDKQQEKLKISKKCCPYSAPYVFWNFIPIFGMLLKFLGFSSNFWNFIPIFRNMKTNIYNPRQSRKIWQNTQ